MAFTADREERLTFPQLQQANGLAEYDAGQTGKVQYETLQRLECPPFRTSHPAYERPAPQLNSVPHPH